MASVKKRTWTHNGKDKAAWVVRYTDPDGKRKLKTYSTFKIADKERIRIEREIETGTHVADTDKLTVRQVCDLYLKRNEDRLRDKRIGRSRYIHVKQTVDKSVIPHLGEVAFSELTVKSVEKFYGDMTRGDKLSPMTAKERIYDFRLIEVFALKRGYTKIEVVLAGLKELRGIRREPIRTFQTNQIVHLLSVAKDRQKHKRERGRAFLECAVNLAAVCGLRYGEIAGLKTCNIDFEGRTIRVRTSLTQYGELKEPKTRAGIRDVPMPDHIAYLLKSYFDDLHSPNEAGLLFLAKNGRPTRASNFHSQLWKPLLISAGLNDDGGYHFHSLRHFAASHMIENMIPITDVASLLGHKKFDVTLQIYAHPLVNVARRSAAFDRMAAGLTAGKEDAAATSGRQGALSH
nr:site-specific integrase [Methylobacterium sp. OTU13CASTA1]